MKKPIRKLTEHEQKTLAPLIARYQQTEQAFLATRQELERSLTLVEPRFATPESGFDFSSLEFYEDRVAQAPQSPTPPPQGDVKRRRRR